MKKELNTQGQLESFYSHSLTTLFEHIADVIVALKDQILLNFGLESFYFIIDNTQKESDEICEEILKKFLESKVKKQAEEIMKKKESNFDVLEIKKTIDEITSLSLKCEIYCNFLLNQIEESFKLTQNNKLELLSSHSSDFLLSMSHTNKQINEEDEFLSEKINRIELEKKNDFENYSSQQIQLFYSQKEKISREIVNSKLKRTIQEAMTYYFQLEQFYMNKMIVNTLQPIKIENQNHFIDIDGFFFVLSSCSSRAISASNCNIASSIIHLVSTHLDFELIKVYFFFFLFLSFFFYYFFFFSPFQIFLREKSIVRKKFVW